MLCLALRAGPERVYQRALRQFSVDEISEGFAAARGLALPSQLRHMLRAAGRDLHAEFVRLLPTPPHPIRIQRWSVRRVGLWALVLALVALVGGQLSDEFTNNASNKTLLNIQNLACTHLEPLWLEAQSVPSASLIPCVRSPLPGWSVGAITVDDGRSVITLDQDRAGDGAVVVRLTATCDTRGAVEVPATDPVTSSYRRGERLDGGYAATWYDRFPGGCLTYRLRSGSDPTGGFAVELPLLLGYTPRQALRQALEERSDGRLHLDPGGAR